MLGMRGVIIAVLVVLLAIVIITTLVATCLLPTDTNAAPLRALLHARDNVETLVDRMKDDASGLVICDGDLKAYLQTIQRADEEITKALDYLQAYGTPSDVPAETKALAAAERLTSVAQAMTPYAAPGVCSDTSVITPWINPSIAAGDDLDAAIDILSKAK